MKMRRFAFAVILAVFCVIGFVACGDGAGGGDDDPPYTFEYELGDTGSGGGKIFFRSADGFTMTDNGQVCHYLEAAPANMATKLAWASTEYTTTDITGTETAIGTGRKNTALILATDENAPAAKACNDYNNGGKSDWFLPSKDELNELYKNRTYVGNFEIVGVPLYLSSSQYNNGYSWDQFFDDGDQDHDHGTKTFSGFCVRAIRAF